MNKRICILTAILIFILPYFCMADSEIDIPVWASKNSKTVNSIEQNNSTSGTNNIKLDNGTSGVNNIEKNNTTSTVNNIEKNTKSNETAINTSVQPITDNPLGLTCGGAILIEQNSGQILYDHNMHEKLRPASVTKVMTILLIMEALDSGRISLTDKIPCSENARNMGGSQIWLDTREQLTVDEMLKAICVVSANDCTVAMAEYLEGSQEAFVSKMNEKARELGMNDTTFKNCHGIDEDGHVTSAYDISLMSRELLTKHPGITKYTTIYMDSLRDGKSQLVNTNKLVRNYEGCTGLKTGSTSVALFNLSASATRNGMSVIAVIMRAETTKIRFNEARKLLDYGFSNYQYKQVAKGGDSVGTCEINKGIQHTTQASFKNDFGFITKKSNSNDIEQNIEIYKNIFAPISKGEKIGEVTFKSNGEILGTVDLVTSEEIGKYGLFSMSKNVYKNWFCLLRTNTKR